MNQADAVLVIIQVPNAFCVPMVLIYVIPQRAYLIQCAAGTKNVLEMGFPFCVFIPYIFQIQLKIRILHIHPVTQDV